MLKIDPTKTSKFEHTTQFRLAEMPPWTLKRLERAVETFSAQLQCAICLCAYDNPVSLPCNHCFCEECIHRALELKTLCPICKAPAKKRRLRYDTTVQELLRATEMLCAAPEDAAAEKQPQSIEMKTTKQTTEKQVTTAPSDVKIAAAKPVKVAATTPERRSPPRRRAQTKNSPGSQTQTLMDAWITGGSTSLRPQLVKMKTEKQTTPVRRASPRRRDLYSEMASPMSPALFEISAPRAAKTQVAEAIAGSSAERLHCEDTMTQIDNVDEQRWSGADAAGADETQLEAKALSPQCTLEITAPNADVDETQLEVVEPKQQHTLSPRRQQSDIITDEAMDEASTPVEEPMQQAITPRRRRSSRNAILLDEIESEMQPEEVQRASSSPHRRRSSRNPLVSDKAAGETQLQDLQQQTVSTRRRRSTTDAATDEARVEAVEPKPRTLTLRERRRSATVDISDGFQQNRTEQQALEPRRRKSATDAAQEKTHVVQAQSQHQATLRSQSATVEVAKEPQMGAIEAKQQLTPLKRRRSETNGFDDTAQTGASERTYQSNGKIAPTNGLAANPPSVFDGQTQLPLEIETFQVGALVDVIERQWSGINKRGGAARIITVHGDGFYGVKFLIGTGMDRRVPGAFIRRPAEDIASDSTPSHSARKRQRRRPSDIMASPNTGAPKTRPSPHSENKVKPKTKALTTHSGMVFLCSGFKENRMQQIDEWAELLGAEVVQYWSNHVTHLIVKCVSAEEVKDEERSMDESDSKSPPQARKDGKRKLFSDPKPGRWVKIRSLKYLKALVAGRWIVSDEWLQVCADHGGYVSEVNYEADGHWKGRRIHDAVKRSRATRDKLLQLTSLNVDRSNVGTMLFADFCFHLIGEFLPPMPPVTELNSLICMGGGKLIPFMDDIPDEMHKRENRTRKLIIVSDKLNPNALRQQTRHLKAKSQVKAVSAAIIVNYLWVINSISEAKLRELP
ncbi:hypothetical protein PRIC2_013418 [Phytophthora ramorum]